jgi:hypothetical protein
VRRKENKELQAEGDESLKGSRQLWLFNPQNMSNAVTEGLNSKIQAIKANARGFRLSFDAS